MKRGFTLFELLLVLFVMSMIVIGGIQYAQMQREKNAAKQLGQRLYQYGIAVAEYARQNPDHFTVPHEVYGIEWLKNRINPETCTTPNLNDPNTCEMFLGKDYHLNFQFIKVANLQGDPDATDDQIYTKLSPNPTGGLTVDIIELGTVYRPGRATSGKAYEVDLSLPGQAATVANQYTQEFGHARITYSVEAYNPGSDINDIHIVGAPTTSIPNVDSGYLRTDGTNKMDGDIGFSTAGDGIVFQNGVKINSMTVAAMSPDSFVLQGQADNSPAPTNTFGDFYVSSVGSVDKKYRYLNGHNKNNSICFLTGTQNLLTDGDICRVMPVSQTNGNIKQGDWVLYLQKEGGSHRSACYARCLVFNQ